MMSVARAIVVVISVVGAMLNLARAQDRPEIFPQLGHNGVISSVAFSPNGRILASGSGDATIKLWDVASGRELRTLRHSGGVNSVAFSPNGRVLASGSFWNKSIKLWDVASGQELRTLRHSGKVNTVAFSPDGRLLASLSQQDHTVKLWDVASGRKLRTLRDPDGIYSVTFSPDGRVLASGGMETIKLWDVASGRKLRALRGHSFAVNTVAFSPDGHVLASGGMETIKLWDVASGRELHTLRGHSNEVTSVAFSPDGHVLASASQDKTVKFWNVASGRELRTLRGHLGEVTSVAFSPDGRILASGSGQNFVKRAGKTVLGTGGNTIKLWDVASGRELHTLRGHSVGVVSVAFSPDGRILASGSADDAVKLWDVASGRELRSLRGHSGEVVSVAFSPDGRVLASGSFDKTIKLWDVASGRELRTLRGHSDYVWSVAFSPNGRILASGSADDAVKLWDVASGRELRTLHGHSDTVNSVAFSPDGRVLASGSGKFLGGIFGGTRDETIKLWDVASGKELRTLRGHSGGVASVAFSPDGRMLASGSYDHTIKFWDVASGRQLRTLRGHSRWVNSVAFSPDGRVLASGSGDGPINLWNVASGRKLRTLRGHLKEVKSVAFSPDGRILASSGAGGTLRIWRATSGRERASLVAFTDGSWLAITPDGYYEASSAKAEENLNVRVGNRVFPIAAYRDKFFRPDLVRLTLAGNSLSKLGYTGIDRVKLAPIVELVGVPSSASGPTLKVKLRITDGGGGIGLVRLFVNGTAVVQDDVPHRSTLGSTATRTYTVQLASGANALRAVAFNADDSMQSNPAVAHIELAVARHATLHAVVVGIQDFKNPRLKLHYSVADAKLFAATLEKYAAPLFKGKPDIRLLITPADTTRKHLIQTMKNMKQSVGPDDLFIFYVASHGFADDGEYYLITSNVGSVSTEHLKTDAMTKEELAALISNIAATKKLMVIDTCQAGALGTALEASLLTRGLDEATALKILSRAVGTTVLAASTSTQEALEGYRGHGLFTYVVAQGLRGKGDVDKHGYVTTLGLAHYVDGQVPELAERQFKRAQYPTVEINGQEFPLAKVK